VECEEYDGENRAHHCEGEHCEGNAREAEDRSRETRCRWSAAFVSMGIWFTDYPNYLTNAPEQHCARPQGLKPLNFCIFLARLKPCPDAARRRLDTLRWRAGINPGLTKRQVHRLKPVPRKAQQRVLVSRASEHPVANAFLFRGRGGHFRNCITLNGALAERQ